jgi:hypothetical protein
VDAVLSLKRFLLSLHLLSVFFFPWSVFEMNSNEATFIPQVIKRNVQFDPASLCYTQQSISSSFDSGSSLENIVHQLNTGNLPYIDELVLTYFKESAI